MKDFLRILSYVKRYRRRLATAFLFTLLFAITSGISIGMILPFANVIFRPEGAAGAQFAAPRAEAPTAAPAEPGALEGFTRFRDRTKQAILAYFVRGDRAEALTRVCVVLAVIFLLKGIANYYQALHM